MDIICWQSVRNRRSKGGLSAWAALSVLCLATGAALAGAQAAGWLHWTGAMAAVPAELMLFAVAGQMATVIRAVLTWLAG